jgi:hypothetical protein
MKNAALAFSALAALTATWDAFFNYRSLWVRYTATMCELKALKSTLDYLALADNAIAESELDALFRRYCAILDDTNRFWVSLREDEKKSAAAQSSSSA